MMKITIDVSTEQLETILADVVKKEVSRLIETTEGKNQVRAAVREHLINYNLIDFVHLIEK